MRGGSRDSWASCDSWFRALRFFDHEWHEGHEWAHVEKRPSTERVYWSNELAVYSSSTVCNACAGCPHPAFSVMAHTGFVGYVRFVVQGSEVPGWTTKDTNGLTQRRKDAKGEEPMPLPHACWSWRLCVLSEAGVRNPSVTFSGPVKDRQWKQRREAAKPRRGRAASRRITILASF